LRRDVEFGRSTVGVSQLGGYDCVRRGAGGPQEVDERPDGWRDGSSSTITYRVNGNGQAVPLPRVLVGGSEYRPFDDMKGGEMTPLPEDPRSRWERMRVVATAVSATAAAAMAVLKLIEFLGGSGGNFF